MTRILLLAVLILTAGLTLACSGDPDTPPEIVIDRTSCTHCRMLISDPRFAVAARTAGGDEQTFDDLRCLLEVSGGALADGTRVWLYDFETAEPVRSSDALLVRQDRLRGPMGGEVLAAANQESASRLAAATEGRTIGTLSHLLAERGGAR
jgi:copper chaperone NosL